MDKQGRMPIDHTVREVQANEGLCGEDGVEVYSEALATPTSKHVSIHVCSNTLMHQTS